MKTNKLVNTCLVFAAIVFAISLIFALSTSLNIKFPWHTKGKNTISELPISKVLPLPSETYRDFLILPNNFPLQDSDIEVIKNSRTKYVLIENGENDYVANITQSLPGLIVDRISQESNFTFCDNSNLTVPIETANPSQGLSIGLFFKGCEENNKVINIDYKNCSLTVIECQAEYLITAITDNYYYNPKNPLWSLLESPNVTTDSPIGAQIFTWNSQVSTYFSQVAYSIEVTDMNKNRLFASGKILAQNTGDYFIPLTSLPIESNLKATIRIWYKIGAVKLKLPLVLTKDFIYSPGEPITTSPTSSILQMSWIPDWGMNDGIESITKSADKWDTISPVWFSPNKNGTLNKESTYNSETLISILRKNNITLIPTISLFDADILKEILNKHFDSHINEIVTLVTANNYAGIDLDYESTYEDDKDLLSRFVAVLASKLHENGKKLSFTAIPKIDDRRIYSFLPQTHQAQDWKAIGAVVDEFRIMAYDYTGQGSLQPGPLSPYTWDEILIRYAIAQMPADKVVLALPLYAHAWPKPNTKNLAGTNNDHTLSSGLQKNTISPQPVDIDYIKDHSEYFHERYDNVAKELRVEYKYNGSERVLYYLNKTAINERLNLAKQYHLKGVCYWRIGGEKL